MNRFTVEIYHYIGSKISYYNWGKEEELEPWKFIHMDYFGSILKSQCTSEYFLGVI